jgi:hypothetical protein
MSAKLDLSVGSLATSGSGRHFLASEFLVVCFLCVRENGARRNVVGSEICQAEVAVMVDLQKTCVVGKGRLPHPLN